MSADPELETHFMTNYLSMCSLIKALQPLMEESATTGPSRIVVTGSFTSVSIAKGRVDLDNLQMQKTDKGANHVGVPNDMAYAQSKLLQYMWCKKFAQNVDAKKICLMV